MKSVSLADAGFCRDKAGLVLIPRDVGDFSCSSAAPADQPGLRVTLCEATGFCNPCSFMYLEILVLCLGCCVDSNMVMHFLFNYISLKDTKKNLQWKLLVNLLKQVKFG